MDFNSAYHLYGQLKRQFDQKQISAEEFERRINDLVVLGPAGEQWQIGVSSGKWYRFDGQSWVEDMPPSEQFGTSQSSPSSLVPPGKDSKVETAKASRRLPVWLLAGCGVVLLALVGLLVGGGLFYYFRADIFPTREVILPPVITQIPVNITPHSLAYPEPGYTALPGFQSDTVLFQDDFSNPSSGWDDIAVSGDYNTYYFEGAYHFLISSDNFSAWANPYLDFPGDVKVEVDASKISGSQYDEFGLICRYTENSDGTYNYYYFAIAIDGLGVIYKVDHNEDSIVSGPPQDMSDVVYSGEQINHIRADCIGDTLTLYVNGQILNSATDSTFSGGDVGLRADSESGGTEIIFDNFIVYSPGF
jgi:hypothetical protein